MVEMVSKELWLVWGAFLVALLFSEARLRYWKWRRAKTWTAYEQARMELQIEVERAKRSL